MTSHGIVQARAMTQHHLTPSVWRAALMFHLKQQAMRDCDATAKAYAACASGRVFSVVWACRQEFGDLNSCLKTRCDFLYWRLASQAGSLAKMLSDMRCLVHRAGCCREMLHS